MNSFANIDRKLGGQLQTAGLDTGKAAEEGTDSHQDWREPPTLILDKWGVIVDCSEDGEMFFGYGRKELARQHVSRVLPQLAGLELLENGEPAPYFSFLCHIGHAFEVKPRAGAAFLSRLSLVCLTHAGQTNLRLIAQSMPVMLG